MANDIETISYINPGDGLNHPIDAVTVSGLTLTSAEKELWNNKQDALSFDSIPTENSNNMVKSGPLYSVITENELVTATALNDLNDRVTTLEDFSETDPTVPGWAKASTKPTYTASEVGALPDTTVVPTESTVTGWGFTKNSGTVTGISMNGSLVGTSGIIDLGTVLTSHQDITGKADKSAAIGSLSLSIDSSNYQITLSGTKVDGTAFSVSNVIDLPLESVVVSGSYNNSTKKVVLTLQNGNTLDFSVADLVAGLQSEITSSNKLSADLIQDGNTNKVVTSTEKSTWNSAVRSVTFNGNSVSVSDGSVSISESDPVFSASPAAGISAADISNWNSKTSNTGTISSIIFNGTTLSVSNGVVEISEEDPTLPYFDSNDMAYWNSKSNITAISMNGSDVNMVNTGQWTFTADLGTVISSITFNGASASVSNGVASISVSIPAEVTEATISSWGFTKNAGTLTSETDPIFSASVAASISASDITNWNSKTSNTGTLTGVTFNGASASVSNGVASISVSIPAEVTEATVSSWGFTKNTGTLTSHATHKLNIGSATATAAASNTITYVESLTGTTTATSGDLTITPTLKTITVPAEVTESTVAGWGFTKNTGTLTSESDPVFTSSVAYTITSANISTWNNKQNALSAGTFNVMLNGTTVGSYSINQDGNSSANIIVPTTLASLTGDSTHRLVTDVDISNWNSKTSNTGTLTGVKFNGTNATVSNGVASISVTIPAEVTESTVAGWGFTKNVGTLTSESDPVFSASVAASISASDIANWNSKTSNTGTVTGSSLTADKVILGNGGTAIKNSTYGISTTAPASGSDDTTLPTSKAVYSAITTALTSVLKYKGTIGTGGTVTSLPATHSVGDVYVVSVSGTYAGKECEVGDYILCKTAGTSVNNAHWDVVNGENQVDNKSASLASAGSSATIATVDGTNITISTPASWTGVDKTGTLTGVSFNGTAASISNGIASISANVLPSVSASDNGKILQVSSGSWSLVTPISVYTSSSAPNNNNGIDGDLYIQTS